MSNMNDIRMLIDCRENILLKHFLTDQKELNNVESKSLELGDIQFLQKNKNNQENDILMIIERKTIKDLASSIKDGRYMEQKQRLLSYRNKYPYVKIAYILEGYYSFSTEFTCNNMGNKPLSGSIINMMLRDNIHIWVVHNEKETIDLIENIFTRFLMDTTKYFNTNMDNTNMINQDLSNNSYIPNFHAVHAKKKDNIDEKVCLILQLSCIPGLSGKKAQEIVDKLQIKSICSLCQILKNDEIYNEGKQKKDQKNSLKNISGIGPKLHSTIKRFLLIE